MSFVAFIIDKIAEYVPGAIFLEYIYSWGTFEIKLMVILLALLFAFLVFRLFGVAVFWILLFIYMITYVVYLANISGKIQERDSAYDIRMHGVQNEIEKK